MLERNVNLPVDVAWFKAKLSKALEMRERLYSEPFYRLVHAEADGLPGVVIDRFGDTVVLQPNAAWAEMKLDALCEALLGLGGITTILEKSLGAAAKAGATPLTAVYEYGEKVTEPGFVFMDTPGYDPVSATGQIAGGAQMVVFTTGRGSAFGSKPSPTIKVATSDQLFAQMPDDMDLNTGDIVSSGVSIAAKGQEIFDHIRAVASGQVTKSEELGLGDNEFVPWQIGAVM